jgi:pimeloyl-ACP methyl ester carboxylesterase
MPNPPALPRGGFTLPINGFDMYCEVGGDGPLLVFLPGALVGVDVHRHLVEAFRKRFTVLTGDAKGQGRSTLGRGPITYVSMTSDVIRLLDHFGIGEADFFGIGDGGVCGFHLLVDYSHRVRSVSMSGAPYSHAAYTQFGRDFIDRIGGRMLAPTGYLKVFRDSYAMTSPNPAQFDEVARRVAKTWGSQPNFNKAMLATIEKPALVISCDRDEFISEAAFRRVAAWIPKARLAHFPGMGHLPAMFRDALVAKVADFVASI